MAEDQGRTVCGTCLRTMEGPVCPCSKKKACKHYKPLEREWLSSGHMRLYCYGCGTDINDRHSGCEGACLQKRGTDGRTGS